MEPNKQNDHPILRYNENSERLQDLGDFILKDLLHAMGTDFRPQMMQLALTCQQLQNVVTNDASYWRDAIQRDYNLTTGLSDFNGFKIYHLLSIYKGVTGRYFVNQNGSKYVQTRRRRSRALIEILEIKITDDLRLEACIWRTNRPANELTPIQKKAPFINVKMSEIKGDKHHFLNSQKHDSSHAEQEEDGNEGNEWHIKNGTTEDILTSAGSLAVKVMDMLEANHIMRLEKIMANDLESKYLNNDGSWPGALPKPGVYVNFRGYLAFIRYSSDSFRITMPENAPRILAPYYDVTVATAFIMTLEQQQVDFDSYMAHVGGLQGNPKYLNGTHVFIPPNGSRSLIARAWYSPSPPIPRPLCRWKVVVINKCKIFLYVQKNHITERWIFIRRPDIE